MPTVNPWKVGLVFGVLLGGCHLAWALCVAIGWAQPLLDFILRIHFIAPVWTVMPFNVTDAIILVAVTGGIGAVTGWLVGLLWNCAAR